MFTAPKLTVLANNAIKELQASNIQPTPEEVLLLNRLGELAMFPDDFRLLDFCYQSYGNLKIYPLTLGAALWLQHYEKEFGPDNLHQTIAILYAMSNSRNPDAFDFQDAKDCNRILYKFGRKINLTEEEIQSILARFTVEKVEGKKKVVIEGMEVDENVSMIPGLAVLMNTYGKDTQYWLWHESEDTCMRYINEAVNIKSEGRTSVTDDRSALAIMELKSTVARIKKSRIVEPVTPVIETIKEGI